MDQAKSYIFRIVRDSKNDENYVVSNIKADNPEDLNRILKAEMENYPNAIEFKVKTEKIQETFNSLESAYDDYFKENRTKYPNIKYGIKLKSPDGKYNPTDEYVDVIFEAKYVVYGTEEEIPAEKLRSYEEEAEKIAKDFVNKEIGGKNLSDAEKALKINDYLVKRAAYHHEGVNTYYVEDHIAYGVLSDRKKGVCESYAKAFQLLAEKSGLTSIYVTGQGKNPNKDKGEAHAWNMVKIDGQWYSIDTTWNDIGEGSRYDYFLKSDDDMKATHTRSTDFNYPTGNGTKDFVAELKLK
ncbi:transglutaminase/protease [Clostridium tetani 12124569]|uniref:transglutaminase domain-containing protein n=1 Tax=Clostridium tetani TaxID=1513 RepID=UPI0003C0C913|nr:transglutaminase domain-containing protein [Clostridium tetani]CDI48530.1 transglutaminase/protease [Clostridium tetani 12124569]